MGTRVKKTRRFWSFVEGYNAQGRNSLDRYPIKRLERELKIAKRMLTDLPRGNYYKQLNNELIDTVEDEIAYRILLGQK